MKHNNSKYASIIKYTTTKINFKNKARFGHLLWPPAWKWNRFILRGVGKSGSK